MQEIAAVSFVGAMDEIFLTEKRQERGAK